MSAVGWVLVATGVALLPWAAAILRHGCPERRYFFARWGFSHAGLVLLAGIGANVAAALLLPGSGVVAGLVLTISTLGGAVAVAAWHARRLQPEGLSSFGLEAGGTLRATLIGLALYATLLPGIVGLERVWPVVRGWIELGGEPSPLLDGILELEGAALLAALAICVAVGPLLEEVLFRGYLQPLFVQNFSEKGGVAVTSLLFAALHGADAFLPLFGLACVLGAIKLRTQRLVAVWVVHAAHNALVLFVAFRFPEVREIVH